MKSINLFFVILTGFVVCSCGNNSTNPKSSETEKSESAELIYSNLINNFIPVNRESGSCNVGNTRGDAYFTLYSKSMEIGVKYRVITSFSQYTGEFNYSRWVEENGKLEELKLNNDDANNGYYQINGKWNNESSGDGYFTLKIFEEEKKNTLLLQISGSSWSYFENIEFENNKFEEIKKLLRNPNVQIDTKKSTKNDSLSTNSTMNETNTSNESNDQLVDLCNYTEYISETKGVNEKLEFMKDENGNLTIYYSSNGGKKTKLGYSNNTVYFYSSRNKLYKIQNIRDQTTKFDLLNPDGIVQQYQAIER